MVVMMGMRIGGTIDVIMMAVTAEMTAALVATTVA